MPGPVVFFPVSALPEGQQRQFLQALKPLTKPQEQAGGIQIAGFRLTGNDEQTPLPLIAARLRSCTEDAYAAVRQRYFPGQDLVELTNDDGTEVPLKAIQRVGEALVSGLDPATTDGQAALQRLVATA